MFHGFMSPQLWVHPSFIWGKYPATSSYDIPNNAKEKPQKKQKWSFAQKIIKQNFPNIFNFIENKGIYLTNKLVEILFLMFSRSIQSKISIKQSFSFYNVQLVVKKSLRTSWTSSFLTDNSGKSAM